MTKLLHADLTNGVVDSALKFAKIFDKSEEGFAKGGLARLPSGVRATVAVSAPPRSGRCSDVRVHKLGTHTGYNPSLLPFFPLPSTRITPAINKP